MEGAVRSTVTVFATVFAAGPVCEEPLVTELAFNVKLTIPSEHDASAMLYEAPDPEIETVQVEEPLPLKVKSDGINPVTFSEKLNHCCRCKKNTDKKSTKIHCSNCCIEHSINENHCCQCKIVYKKTLDDDTNNYEIEYIKKSFFKKYFHFFVLFILILDICIIENKYIILNLF
jgi:hypothetical protein